MGLSEKNKIEGVWPVMLTPYTDSGSVDYHALAALIDWYQSKGVDGLFAVCQSSEMFFLSLDERIKIASFVKKHATVPVVASGHISSSQDDQQDELRRMSDTGIDALILVVNRLAEQTDTPDVWLHHLEDLLVRLDPQMPLGFYECPYPYKRLISLAELSFCVKSGRFLFLKDTCCDQSLLRQRLDILRDSPMRLFNANATTLLDSLEAGAAGYSGVMANFHPELYAWLIRHWRERKNQAELVQAFLMLCSQIERQLYPVNAKWHLQSLGLPISIKSRTKDANLMSPLFQEEVRQMGLLADQVRACLGQSIDHRPLATID